MLLKLLLTLLTGGKQRGQRRPRILRSRKPYYTDHHYTDPDPDPDPIHIELQRSNWTLCCCRSAGGTNKFW